MPRLRKSARKPASGLTFASTLWARGQIGLSSLIILASLPSASSYGDEDGGGIYHSIYDDFYWYTHFSDTDFSYGRALSQTAGTAVMRLADADLLPYDFTALADTINRYLDELQKLLTVKAG